MKASDTEQKTEVRFYEQVDDDLLKFAVIIAAAAIAAIPDSLITHWFLGSN